MHPSSNQNRAHSQPKAKSSTSGLVDAVTMRSFLLLLLILLSLQSNEVCAFAFGAFLRQQPKGMTTTRVVGGRDSMNVLKEASEFFVDAWWTDKVGGMFMPRQRESLQRSQFMDFRGRYAGSSKLSIGGMPEAELILCQTQEAGIIGCAGLELTEIPMQAPGQQVVQQKGTGSRLPLMSNVAVSRQFRRKGIAELLVSEIERVACQWGHSNCYLYVDNENVPAVKLYQKLGYRKVWVDTDGKTQLPTANGNFQSRPTTIMCMKKALGRGILGRIAWPF